MTLSRPLAVATLLLALSGCGAPATPEAQVEAACADRLEALDTLTREATAATTPTTEVPAAAGEVATVLRAFVAAVEPAQVETVSAAAGSAATAMDTLAAAAAGDAAGDAAGEGAGDVAADAAADADAAAGPGSEARLLAYREVSRFWAAARRAGAPACVPAGLDGDIDTAGFTADDPAADCRALTTLDEAQTRLFLDGQTGALDEAQIRTGVAALVGALQTAAAETTGAVQQGLSQAATDMATFEAAVRSTGEVPPGMTQATLLAGITAAKGACASQG